MKTFNSAIVAAMLVIGVSSSQAVLVLPTTNELPGVVLGSATNNFGGTVVVGGDITVPFTDLSPSPNFTGSLRTTVVRNAGGTLDFYYQLANNTTSPANSELYRLTLNTFSSAFSTSGTSYEAFNIANGLTGIVGGAPSVNGTMPAYSVDRQGAAFSAPGGFGFDFGDLQFVGDLVGPFSNLLAGQTSNFLLVRTNATQFTGTSASVNGVGTAQPIRSFAPIPEPTTILVGLALTTVVGCSRRRKAIGVTA